MLNSEEVWPLWAVTVGVAVPLVAALLACICCRKTVPKSELLGLAGMVKITNPEENLNHNQHSNETAACTVVSCADESNKRASTTANRSLPDIPVDSERMRIESGDTLWENSEPNGDTSSELYATVEENKHVAQHLVSATRTASRATKKLQDGPADESKSSEHSSLSQTDDSFSPYARLKAEHPYDKLRREHPYAQVGATAELDMYAVTQGYGSREQSEESQLLRPSTSGDNTPRPLSGQAGMSTNPVPPPRTRKSSSHNSLVLPPAATLLPGSVPDIQAATAIAGRISANQELPYMTPPIPVADPPPPQQQQQTNFSGDSQDSKGYTSISVREPLANIKAQTKVANQRSRTQELVDSHYATVSDDSDEMYAAIDEPAHVYTSGSETYAQIQPLAVLEPTAEGGSDSTHYPPQPPSVDSLKQVAQVHSRQASSSSAASSVANLGSPKPEKRQANSPLPPPPAGSPDLYAAVDKKNAGLAVSRNLEEMYAKVMKKKQRGDVDQGRQPEPTDNLSQASANSIDTSSPELRTQQDSDVISACSLDQDSFAGLGSVSAYEKLQDSPSQQFLMPADIVEPSYESLGGPSSIGTSYHDPGYEVVQRHPSDCDPNYEELRPKLRDPQGANMEQNGSDALQEESDKVEVSGRLNTDPGYEQVRSGEVVSDPRMREVSYASINKNSESVCVDHAAIDNGAVWLGVPRLDPGYKQVSKPNEEQDPGYEQVNSQNKCSPRDKIGYERVRSRGSSDGDTFSGPEPDYASVDRNREPSDDTGEPNYESMSSEGQDLVTEDPNYESVSYFDLPGDPPYERLQNETRDSDDTSSGYEKVKDHDDPSVNSTGGKRPSGGNTEPGYEEVGTKWDIVNGDSDARCNSSSSIDRSLESPTTCHQNEDVTCRPHAQTSPTRM